MDDAGKLEILDLNGNLCQDTVMFFRGEKKDLDFSFFLVKGTGGRKTEKCYFSLGYCMQ